MGVYCVEGSWVENRGWGEGGILSELDWLSISFRQSEKVRGAESVDIDVDWTGVEWCGLSGFLESASLGLLHNGEGLGVGEDCALTLGEGWKGALFHPSEGGLDSGMTSGAG